MSLILEALKKSENERLAKANNTNTLVTSSFGEGTKETEKSWIPSFLMIALMVNAVLLGGLFLSSKNDDNETSTANNLATNTLSNEIPAEKQAMVTAAPVEQTAKIIQPTPTRSVKAATPLAEQLVNNPITRNAPDSSQSWDQQQVAINAAPAMPADFAMIETEEVKAKPENKPISLRELNDEDLADQLNDYEINTHIYNGDDPDRSFVLINMEKYRNGDKMKNSSHEISEITADGVVIEHATGQVLISAN